MVSKVCGEIFRSVLYGHLLFYVDFSNLNFVLIFTMFSNKKKKGNLWSLPLLVAELKGKVQSAQEGGVGEPPSTPS